MADASSAELGDEVPRRSRWRARRSAAPRARCCSCRPARSSRPGSRAAGPRMSLVLVLPCDPVTPMTVMLDELRDDVMRQSPERFDRCRPRRPPAPRPVGWRAPQPNPPRPQPRRSRGRRRARRRRRRTSPPGTTLRESIDGGAGHEQVAEPSTTWPSTAAAISARDIAINSASSSCRRGRLDRSSQRERLDRFRLVVEGVDRALDLLAGLVTLAGDEDRVAGVGFANGEANGRRRSPISTISRARPDLASTREHLGADRSSGSSLRGLSSVTTSTSASRAPISPIIGRLPRSRSPPAPITRMSRPWVTGRSAFKRSRQGVGLVGVVDDHSDTARRRRSAPSGHRQASRGQGLRPRPPARCPPRRRPRRLPVRWRR